MPEKNFIKDNFVLIVGLTLPVVLMFAFMLMSSMPQVVSDPPKYDLVFSIPETPPTQVPISVQLIVKGGELKAQYVRNKQPESYSYNTWKKLYLYDHESRKVKELAFGYPAEMEKIDAMREETVEATKGLKLNTTVESPDGYTLTTDSYSHSGELFGIFGGSSYSNEPILKKGNTKIRLTTSGGNSFNYQTAEFIGWVGGKN
jgi:hypothetical protein